MLVPTNEPVSIKKWNKQVSHRLFTDEINNSSKTACISRNVFANWFTWPTSPLPVTVLLITFFCQRSIFPKKKKKIVNRYINFLQETWEWSLGWEDPLEEGMVTHSSILAWETHGQKSLVGYSPWGHEELDMTERLPFHFSVSCIGAGNGNPLQCSCLENSRDRGAWWASIYGVAQSQHNWSDLAAAAAAAEWLSTAHINF